MKKILLVANVAKEHVLKFHIPTIKMLVEKGWTIDVACSGDEKVPYCNTQYHMSYKRSPFTLGTLKGINELNKIIKKERYDIIYCHTPVGGLVARVAGSAYRKNGCKIIYFVHGYHFFKGAPLINWLLFYPFEKVLSFWTDAVLTINKEDFEITKKKFGTCDAYLLNGIGVDLTKFTINKKDEIRKKYREILNIPFDATIMIYLAELSENKNQPMLLRVLKEIHKTHANVYLVLAGIDHCYGEFEKMANELNIAKYARFLGWRDDVANLYAMADICTASSIREGLPLNLLEAMASNIPVVATKNRGHEAIISNGSNGFLVDINNYEAMATDVIKLIDDVKYKEKLVLESKKQLQKYESKEILSTLNTIFENYS